MITDGESVTRRELVQMICDEVGCEMPKDHVALGVVKIGMPIVELVAKLRGKRPIINRFKLKFMSTPMTFDIGKARRLLGFEPVEPPRESLRKTIQWYAEHHPEMLPKT
jgi:nucleoside-diphosphate-sugar epimerase